ncbi:MAG: DUF167 domain-containing protein [Patescibacteria group bacterium]
MLASYKEQLKKEGEVYLKIKVKTNSQKNKVKEFMSDGTLKMDIAAEPDIGKANQELIKFLAKEFKVGKNNVEIKSGAINKIKLVKISNN